MEYEKIINLLGNISSNKLPKFTTKNRLKSTMSLMEHIILIIYVIRVMLI